MRLIGVAAVLTSMRAVTGAWDAQRPTEGAYAALLTFSDGAFASLTYNGLRKFRSQTSRFRDWVGEMGQARAHPMPVRRVRALPARRTRPRSRTRAITAGQDYRLRPQRKRLKHQHFGTLLVSCERADLRAKTGWRHDLSGTRHGTARRRAAANGAARRGDRRTLRRRNARPGAAARRRLGHGDTRGGTRHLCVRRAGEGRDVALSRTKSVCHEPFSARRRRHPSVTGVESGYRTIGWRIS